MHCCFKYTVAFKYTVLLFTNTMTIKYAPILNKLHSCSRIRCFSQLQCLRNTLLLVSLMHDCSQEWIILTKWSPLSPLESFHATVYYWEGTKKLVSPILSKYPIFTSYKMVICVQCTMDWINFLIPQRWPISSDFWGGSGTKLTVKWNHPKKNQNLAKKLWARMWKYEAKRSKHATGFNWTSVFTLTLPKEMLKPLNLK